MVLLKGISKTLVIAGALTFIFGDRALREIWNWRFVPAEVCGIGVGILLMILGGTIHSGAAKPDGSPEERGQ